MPDMSMHWDGLAELKNRLAMLNEDVQRNVVRAAVGAAAREIAKEARLRAPRAETAHWRARGKMVSPGTLAKAIAAGRSRSESQPGREIWRVFVRHGKKEQARGLDAFYAGWVEFGHYYVPPGGKGGIGGSLRQRRKLRSLSSARFVPGRPFLRPAFESKKEAAVQAMVDRLKQRLDKAGA